MRHEVQVALLARLKALPGAPDERPIERLDSAVYTSAEQLDRERAVLFRRYPRIVGHASALREPGAFLTDDSGPPLLLVRTREGALKGALKAGSTGVVIAGLFALGGGVVGIGPLAIVAIGGGLMAAYGVVVGSISSADEPERHLRALERDVEDGKVLIAVETDDEELQAICEDIFAAHHGRQIIV